MRDAELLTLCEWSKGQIGWRDTDDDGILDPIDHPAARRSMLIGDADSLGVGDWVDIFTGNPFPTFMRRLPASWWSRDEGRILWDGIRFDGDTCATNVLKWRKNSGGAWHPDTLDLDVAAPVIDSIVVVEGGGPTIGDTLKVWFTDADTRGGRIRAEATSWNGKALRIIRDRFFVQRGAADPPVTEVIRLGDQDVGPWNVVSLVWDVGAGQSASAADSFWHGGVADVRESALKRAGLAVSRGMPNPSPGFVSWELVQDGQAEVGMRVVGVDGREVRSWSPVVLEAGRNRVVWDGLNARGARVPAGRYYLVATDSSGRQRSSPVIIWVFRLSCG